MLIVQVQIAMLYGNGLQATISRRGILKNNTTAAGIDHHEWHCTIRVGRAEQQEQTLAPDEAETFSLQCNFVVAVCGIAGRARLTGRQGKHDGGIRRRSIGA